MSTIYNLEPPPTAKVLLTTTSGDLLLELFAKQTPLASRNFLQHCLDGYYTGTLFHRLVPGFVIQGGDPTNTGYGGESVFEGGLPFEDEFHPRLKFTRRGLLGMANEGGEKERGRSNGSQFFLTLGETRELEGVSTLFGRVVGETVFNLVRMGEAEVQAGEGGSERPVYPTRVTGAEVLVNPFEDMVRREVKGKVEVGREGEVKKKGKKKGGKVLLSFGGEEGDEGVERTVLKKEKFNTKLVSDADDVGSKLVVNGASRPAERGSEKRMRRRSSRSKTPPPRVEPSKEMQLPLPKDEEPSRSPSTSPEPAQLGKVSSLLDRTNAQIADLKASMKRNVQMAPAVNARKKSALEQMIPETSMRGRKRKHNGDAPVDKQTLDILNEFRAKLEQAPPEIETATIAVAEEQDKGHDKEEANNNNNDDDEAELCDLHFIASCQSCRSWDNELSNNANGQDDDNEGWMSHALSFEKDRLGKDLNWKKKNEEELVVIDPREKANDIREEQRAKKMARMGGTGAWDRDRDRGKLPNCAVIKALADQAAGPNTFKTLRPPSTTSYNLPDTTPGLKKLPKIHPLSESKHRKNLLENLNLTQPDPVRRLGSPGWLPRSNGTYTAVRGVGENKIMQAQRTSLKRSASGAFARQPEVQEITTRNSQSPKMPTLHSGKALLVPHQSQPNDTLNSTDLTNGHTYAARDQYQYPDQADLLHTMPSNGESPGLLDNYRDQGHPYFKDQLVPAAANEGIRYGPDSQMDVVKYHHNNAMSGYPPVPSYDMQAPTQGYPNQEDDLDQQALRAKRDAEAKRKQIPPFVQKLSSFLKDPAKESLIRWSKKGDSFIVIDEDEFARTLIPELFKHNNYASFVRQLNMYGFHKQVALSDGSMRAGEKKNKSPSEYSNPYFQRDRPNLLWLIQKPKNPPTKGTGKGGARAKQEDADEEVDDTFNRDSSIPPNYGPIDNATGISNGRQPLMLGNTGNSLPPDQFSAIQQELSDIRANQVKITKLLNMTQIRHDQLYHQAKAFHHMHEQHDNSINAILTFLATIYNKNLDQGTTMDMGNLFNGLPNKQGQGNVVEVNDDNTQSPTNGRNTQQPFRRQPLLLKDGSATSPAVTVDSPNDYNQSYSKATPQAYDYPTIPRSDMNSSTIQELSDRGTPSNRSSQSPQIKPNNDTDQQMPEADIMSLINSHNANALSRDDSANTQRMEFPEAFSHLQNTNNLTPRQREDMLTMMSNELANSPQNGSNNVNNSLTSYDPIGNNARASLEQLEFERDRISQIEKQLKEQSARMENLKGNVVPLSPTGSIPGVTDQNYNNPNPELAFDDFFNTTDYFNGDNNVNGDFDWSNTNGDLPDIDFSIDAPAGENGADTGAGMFNTDGAGVGRVTEAGSSEATSPANTVYDGTNGGEEAVGSPGKKRRLG